MMMMMMKKMMMTSRKVVKTEFAVHVIVVAE